MIIENFLFCKEILHDKKPLIAFCLNQNCKDTSGLCSICIEKHQNHHQDLQSIENVRKILEDKISDFKRNFQFCEELIQSINLIKIELTRSIQNIQSVLKFSSYDDIDMVKQLLLNSTLMKQGTSIIKKTSIELKRIKEVLNDLKTQIEFSQSNLSDGQQQEFKEYFKQANQTYAQGNYSKARDLFKYCVKLDPSNINCKQRIGMCLKMEGIYDQAIAVFDLIIFENPAFVDSLCHKADTLRLMGKYNEALNYFDKTLQLDKQNLIALSYKGETLRKMTNYQESLVYFDKALEINPKNLDSLFGKGDSLRCLRRNDEALYVLLQGEQIDPNNASIQFSKGICYVLKAKGKIQEALQCFQKCIAINPQYRNYLEKEIQSIQN